MPIIFPTSTSFWGHFHHFPPCHNLQFWKVLYMFSGARFTETLSHSIPTHSGPPVWPSQILLKKKKKSWSDPKLFHESMPDFWFVVQKLWQFCKSSLNTFFFHLLSHIIWDIIIHWGIKLIGFVLHEWTRWYEFLNV